MFLCVRTKVVSNGFISYSVRSDEIRRSTRSYDHISLIFSPAPCLSCYSGPLPPPLSATHPPLPHPSPTFKDQIWGDRAFSKNQKKLPQKKKKSIFSSSKFMFLLLCLSILKAALSVMNVFLNIKYVLFYKLHVTVLNCVFCFAVGGTPAQSTCRGRR